MKVAFHTLGCKVNTYETESIWELFAARGYERVDIHDYADVYVINTCTVTNTGDAKSRKEIRRAVRRNPEAVVAVMGCYSQIDPAAIAAIDGVDIILGTKHRERLVFLVEDFLRERRRIQDVTDVSRYRVFDETHITHFTEHTRAFLKIQDGCSNFCSFCIIPYARGPVRSRDSKQILEEAKALVDNGYQELVLTGIHTGGYGQDLPDYELVDLLRDLEQIDGLRRLRLSSIEINELTDELLHWIRQSKVFAPHLHIPLQSGSDDILRAMRRKYDKQTFLNRLREIRDLIPGIAITTDLIVGFPGETEEHFAEMKAFVSDCAFSELHVFPYSRRSGTKAAQMTGHLDGLTKSVRVNEMLLLNEQLADRFIATQDDVEVLFETSDEEFTYGHTDTYVAVKTNRDPSLHNNIVTCTITHPVYGDTLVDIKK
jgi:threonylcarbamoyladenosine tRNA methylthiotransferase MtaB